MAKITVNQKPRQAKSPAVALSRDMRNIPATRYQLPNDGRKWRTLCDQRKQLADWLATFGDADGSRIFPAIETMLTAFDTWSRAKLFRRLAELRELGILKSEGLIRERGARIRRLIPNAVLLTAEVSDSPVSHTQPKSHIQ
jgi:hypothetical protein